MSGEEGGGIPEGIHILPPLHVPAMFGAPAFESYSASYWILVMAIVLGLSLVMRLLIKVSPGVVQNLIEWLVETVEELAESILGRAAARFMPLFAALFLFILTGNLLGLIPGCMSPTADYHTNAAMAIVVALATQWAGIRAHGLKGYLKHFMPPPCPWWLMYTLMWWMWPLIHILEQFIRPISLTMRLFGNIYAKEILLGMLAFIAATFIGNPSAVIKAFSVLPFILRPAIILLGTLVSIVQAAVFTILAMVFVALAMEGHEEGHGEAHAAEGSQSDHSHN